MYTKSVGELLQNTATQYWSLTFFEEYKYIHKKPIVENNTEFWNCYTIKHHYIYTE